MASYQELPAQVHLDSKLCEHCENFLTDVIDGCDKEEEWILPGRALYRTLSPRHDTLATKQCADNGCRLCYLIWHHSELDVTEVSPDDLCAEFRCYGIKYEGGEADAGIRLSWESKDIEVARPARYKEWSIDVLMEPMDGENPFSISLGAC